jgi:hypothetical protein
VDKGEKDKLARSPGENGGQGAQKHLHLRTVGDETQGKTRKGWEEEVKRDLEVLGVKRRREMVTDSKNRRTLFDRPKPTVGCSANGTRRSRTRRRRIVTANSISIFKPYAITCPQQY